MGVFPFFSSEWGGDRLGLVGFGGVAEAWEWVN